MPVEKLAIVVGRERPTAEAHLAAVRAALRDGRLDVAAWAARAGLEESVARLWAAGHVLEDTWEAYAWAAAVTTTVPGWQSARDAVVRETGVRDSAE